MPYLVPSLRPLLSLDLSLQLQRVGRRDAFRGNTQGRSTVEVMVVII
jgi:hypothetical protein